MPDVYFDEFEWDADKAALVWRDRKVDLTVACYAVLEPNVLTALSDDGSAEDRWISIGVSSGRLYTVVHCDREERIRIITAWESTKHEQYRYRTRPR